MFCQLLPLAPHSDISREQSVFAEWEHGGRKKKKIEQHFQLQHSLLWHAAHCLFHRDVCVLWSVLDWTEIKHLQH